MTPDDFISCFCCTRYFHLKFLLFRLSPPGSAYDGHLGYGMPGSYYDPGQMRGFQEGKGGYTGPSPNFSDNGQLGMEAGKPHINLACTVVKTEVGQPSRSRLVAGEYDTGMTPGKHGATNDDDEYDGPPSAKRICLDMSETSHDSSPEQTVPSSGHGHMTEGSYSMYPGYGMPHPGMCPPYYGAQGLYYGQQIEPQYS